MARFLKGIVGAYSGRVGNIVGSNWRSVDYVRSLPKMTGKKATESQITQRAKFALGVAFLSPIKDLLNLGYSDKLLGKATGYNKALQALLNTGISGIYPALTIDYAKVVISKGSLANLMGVSWSEPMQGELEVTWTPETNKYNAFDDDAVVLLMYNKTKNFFSILESATRVDALLSLTLPPVYAGDTLVGWIFTGHRDGVKTSMSYYLGELVLV
jgi:hypothetical protein